MNTRERNMQRRRERILDEARRAIAEGGYPALNTRALAKAAGVTQPTLYNLIGNKEQIVLALVDEAMSAIEARLQAVSHGDPVDKLASVAIDSIALFRSDETYYRAALLAAAVIEDQQRIWDRPGGTFHRSLALARDAVLELERRGLLRGSVSTERTAEVMLGAYRSACDDWARRMISMDEFERQALAAVYLTTAVDAKPKLRAELVARLASLEDEAEAVPA